MVSPIAETATTTSLPAFFASATRAATRLIAAASDTEEPPYFWTIRLIGLSGFGGGGRPGWNGSPNSSGRDLGPWSGRVRRR